MFDRLRARTQNIFLINSEGLSVFTVDDGVLKHVGRFSEEDVGYENFEVYLQENKPANVTLLVDTVTEDFVVEKLAHVSLFDRTSFLNRKCEQQFRGSDYRSARILGRESGGRKDDRVLFSAITKNQPVDSWVRVLLRNEIPVKGVTSPAYALCKLAEHLDLLTADKIMLVNWEDSGLRHTFIDNGKMMFSRTSPLPPGSETDISRFILDSCNQSNDYLERIGLVGFDEPIDVHVITPLLDEMSFDDVPSNRNYRSIEHHNSVHLMEEGTYSGKDDSITALLLCIDWGMRDGEYSNIYAPSPVLRYYHLAQARKWIGIGSIILLLTSALVSTPLLLDAIERQGNISRIRADIIPVQLYYDNLRSAFPETPIPSEAMELAVRNFDTIKRQESTPIEFMQALSQVVSQFPAINITAVDWNLDSSNIDLEFTEALLQNETEINVEIYGVLLSNRSVSQSDQRLRQFMASLREIAGTEVTPIARPIESDPFSEVNTVLDDDEFDSEFAVNVRLGS